jgi:hypothetical protein
VSDPGLEGEAPGREGALEDSVRRVRVGHGANCSSVGSVVDAIFATATIGAAVFASVVAALGSESVRVVGSPGPKRGSAPVDGPGAPPDPNAGKSHGPTDRETEL